MEERVQSAYISMPEQTHKCTQTHVRANIDKHTDTQRVASQAHKVEPFSRERQTGGNRRLQDQNSEGV